MSKIDQLPEALNQGAGMINSFAKQKRVKRPDEPIIETESYKLIRQLEKFLLCKKYTGGCFEISADCALFAIELNDKIRELYSK